VGVVFISVAHVGSFTGVVALVLLPPIFSFKKKLYLNVDFFY
jgi:hypothetical protein